MITLENERLLIRIGQGRGARIEHFIDKKNCKDWVWRSPVKEPTEARQNLDLAASFDEHWAGGWDEVFPNDAPTEVEGHKLVDHGELWRRNWELAEEVRGNKVRFRLSCVTYPASVTKTFILHPGPPELTIDYSIESLHDRPLPFIFKYHPALAIETDDSFRLPNSPMEPVALDFSTILGKEEKFIFPEGLDRDGRPVSIDRARPQDGRSREFVRLSELPEGSCALTNYRTKSELLMKFCHNTLPYVWLFQSYGGFMGHYVAMLEPTNAGHYDLAQAWSSGKCGVLQPGETKQLSLKLAIGDL